MSEGDAWREALADFWAAEGDTALAEASAAVVALDPEFDDVYAALRAGRPYAQDVPRGRLIRTHTIAGREHHYMIFVPRSYDPTREWPVRWDLHGGMGQPEWRKADGSWSPGWAAIDDYENSYITVIPAGWWDSMWWEGSQVDSFHAILDEVKRTWNVHEDRIVMFGSSDGAVATWFYGFRDPDPWAFYVGHVGFPARLTNRSMRADGQMHLSNLEGQYFYVRNGVKDRIVDIKVTRGYLEVFEDLDVEIEAYEHPRDGHDLTLTRAQEVEPLERMRDRRRDPLPDRVSWATERTDRYNRRAWLVIEELSADAAADDTNVLPRIHGRNVPRTPAPDVQPWGRVALERDGNTILAATTGVARFRLLLSPDEFDLDQPVRLELDGEVVFDERVEPSLQTLLHWAARDADRRRLFGAELTVDVEAGAVRSGR